MNTGEHLMRMKKNEVLILLVAFAALSGEVEAKTAAKPQPWSAEFEGIHTHTATAAEMDEKIEGMDRCLKNNPYVAGVAIKIRWNQLHPEKDLFHLDKLETLVEMISGYGKHTHLVIIPGFSTPEWVYAEGAVKAGPFKIGKNDPSYSSLPWDPVFMEIWEKELRVIAGKYADDPRIAAIGVMGHNFKGEEMHAPKVAEVEKYDWSREVVLQNWKHWIDTYANLFSKKKLILTVSQMYKQDADSPLPEQVAAYFVETIGQNAILQTDQLDGRSDAMKVSSAVCKKYADRIPHGHEMVGSFKEQPERQGSPEMTLYNAARIGNLRYLQLWRRDCDDPQYAKTLLDLYEKYKTMPIDDIKKDLQRADAFKEEDAREK